MARTNVANSATSEFFINVVDNLFLNYKDPTNPGYAVFGTVVQGMDVVDAIAAEPTAVVNGFADVPLTDVTISMALQTK
jgi:cyclophilin family peptidyl-prolyl cis-trans isomerase